WAANPRRGSRSWARARARAGACPAGPRRRSGRGRRRGARTRRRSASPGAGTGARSTRSPRPPRQSGERAAPSLSWPLLAEAELHREQCRLGAVVHPELPEDARDVVLDRLLADEEPLPDLPVRLAGGEELQDLLLARGERVELLAVALLLALALELAQHAPRDLARQHRLARGGPLDRRADLVGRDVLEQIADGAGLERREHPLGVREGGQHDDADLRVLLVERARQLDAALARQLDVHEDDLRPPVRAQRLPHLLAAPRRGADAAGLARLQALPEPIA